MPADIRIRIDPDGRVFVLHAFGRNLDVEVHDDRANTIQPGSGYRWQTVPSGIDTNITPDAGKEAR